MPLEANNWLTREYSVQLHGMLHIIEVIQLTGNFGQFGCCNN